MTTITFVKKNKKKFFFVVAPIIILVACIAYVQMAYDKSAPPFSLKLKTVRRDLLPEKILPYSHFGFRLFLADMYWIRAIQDYVGWDNKELFFLDYFKNITTLDPRFEHPYLFAIWTIPDMDRKDIERLHKVAAVAEKGMEAIPTSWQIPYHLGTQYYLFTKSYERAKEYLRSAAEKENAPPGVYLNYSSFVVNDIKGYKASHDLVKVIYDTTKDETLKKILELGLEQNVIHIMLERGILAYKTTKGVYPKTIDVLEKENYIALPETFKQNFTVRINTYTGSFTIEEK